MKRLLVSIVVFRSNIVWVQATLQYLAAAVQAARQQGVLDACQVVLIDNDLAPVMPAYLEGCALPVELLRGHGNVGYGRGHNLALAQSADFHLILNPDVKMTESALVKALQFMQAEPTVGLLAGEGRDEAGHPLYLAKRQPTVFDLLLRGFAPGFVKRYFASRLARYRMEDRAAEPVLWDPPIVSGCFMLFRGEVLRRVGGFDPRFFLYFEDFDLSLRTAKVARLVVLRSVQLVHLGGDASRKGWWHVKLFGRSMCQFFNIHGWRWW